MLAHPDVTVVHDGTSRRLRAVELTGDERDHQFERAVAMNPGWTRFRDRARNRDIR